MLSYICLVLKKAHYIMKECTFCSHSYNAIIVSLFLLKGRSGAWQYNKEERMEVESFISIFFFFFNNTSVKTTCQCGPCSFFSASIKDCRHGLHGRETAYTLWLLLFCEWLCACYTDWTISFYLYVATQRRPEAISFFFRPFLLSSLTHA